MTVDTIRLLVRYRNSFGLSKIAVKCSNVIRSGMKCGGNRNTSCVGVSAVTRTQYTGPNAKIPMSAHRVQARAARLRVGAASARCGGAGHGHARSPRSDTRTYTTTRTRINTSHSAPSALALPRSNALNAVSYTATANVVVEPAGPPPVST